MKQLIQISERAIQHKPYIAETTTTTTFEPVISRVPLNTNNSNNRNNSNTRQTISMTQPTQQLQTISTPAVTMVEQSKIAKHKNRKKRHKHMINTTAPAHNTISRTQKT